MILKKRTGWKKEVVLLLTMVLFLCAFLGEGSVNPEENRRTGFGEMVDPCPREVMAAGNDDLYRSIFDAAYYAQQYPDVAYSMGTDPGVLYHHFVYQGIKEGRNPSAEFDLTAYKTNYPDLVESFGYINALYYRHYVKEGKSEGRVASRLLEGVTVTEETGAGNKGAGEGPSGTAVSGAVSYGMNGLSVTPDPSGNIVQVVDQIYSYEDMMRDIDILTATYPQYLSAGILGTSYEGRPIPELVLGNPEAPYKVLVQSSIHAREYITSQLVMKMVEMICLQYETETYRGIPYSRLFDQVSFTVIPMANPDGVSISQYGMDSVILDETADFLYAQTGGQKKKLIQIKANARGVDLNRNFPIGFGQTEDKKSVRTSPDLAFFCGYAPLSEPESMILANLVANGGYSCFLSFHTMGNIIYYGSCAATPQTNASCKKLAALLNGLTGYKYYGPTGHVTNGTFADYATYTTGKPSATVELGNVNPVPIWQFPTLYEQNKKDFPAVAFAVLTGGLN